MNSRLLQFLNAENITQAQFADSIGVARASISHIISGRNKPSYEFISAMMREYPQLNPEWLILGKGRMYNDNGGRKSQQPADGSYGEDLLFPADNESPVVPVAQQPSVQIVSQMKPVPSKMNSRIFQDGAELKGTSPAQSEEIASTAQSCGADSPASDVLQRKVSKVIVFFDDGTFQEMH